MAGPQRQGGRGIPCWVVAKMSAAEIEVNSETSRVRAALVNSGRHDFSEAEQRLAASRLTIAIGSTASRTVAGQAAFLTATVTAARCFGQVRVEGSLDEPLLCPLPLPAKSLAEAASLFGAYPKPDREDARRVLVGCGLEPSDHSIQAYWNGWSAGVTPGQNPGAIGRGDCALAGVAAGAIAVGQAFLAEQGDMRAGRFTQCLSLWSPELGEGGAEHPGPQLNEIYFPRDLWLIGLGNLGQAYLWSLSMLP